jgi:hypothetical protein
MLTLILLIAVVLGVAVAIMLFVKNRSLSDKLLICVEAAGEDEALIEELKQTKMDLEEDAAHNHEELRQLREGITTSELTVLMALQQRDDAMLHLEKTLESNAANHAPPARIAGEVSSKDGVHYAFSYDPPELAEVTSLPSPQLTESAST